MIHLPAHFRLAGAFGAVLLSTSVQAAPTCYHNYGAIESMKPNKLFLYYPTANDATFPAYAANVSPARTFSIGLLPGAPAGTTAQLRDRIFDVVATDYCEFNVQVLPPTTTNPDSLAIPPARRNMVAIGSDTDPSLFGIAEAVDTGDGDVVDHARVFGGSYGVFCSAQLSGANNTLDRWAMGIGGTAAHEAGHNYGLSHSSTVHTGEDAFVHHIMPAGPSMPCTNRVGERRHFSDQDFGILANNVGLTLQSLANWDFVNPNSATASRLRMEVLSRSGSLTPVSTYTGSLSPWNPPSVVASGTRTFKGISYNRFFVTWQAAKGWASPNQPGSIAGQVRGAEQFHVGTHFSQEDILNTSDQVVIVNATLLDASGNALPLHPRVPTFDTGTLSSNGNLVLGLANLQAANLVLRNWRAFVLPRPAHIDSMMFDPTGGLKLLDNQQEPIVPWRQLQLPTAAELPAGSPDKPGEASFFLGNLLKDGRNVRIKFRNPTTGGQDATVGAQEVNPDVKGALATDPFPGASVFLQGDLVEPDALQWDADKKTFVNKDLVTHVFLQVAGKRAKPVDGSLIGVLRGKVVCSNLNTRQSVSLDANTDGSFDCEKAGLISMHGDRVQVSQVGLVNTPQPGAQIGGLNIAKVTCTNLRTRQTVSFKPGISTDNLDCVKAGLGIEQQSTLQITQVGTVQ